MAEGSRRKRQSRFDDPRKVPDEPCASIRIGVASLPRHGSDWARDVAVN